jgi:hypothetical protein
MLRSAEQRGEQLAGAIKRDVVNSIGVTFERAFKLTRLVVPHFDRLASSDDATTRLNVGWNRTRVTPDRNPVTNACVSGVRGNKSPPPLADDEVV